MSAEIALDLAPQTPLRVRAIAAFCRLLVGGYTRRIVEGAEQLPSGAAILAFNHLSWIDPFAVIAAHPHDPRLYLFGPKELSMDQGARNRVIRWTRIAVPFRPDRRDLVTAVRRVESIAAAGAHLAIAGEGRISVGERRVEPLSGGIATFARRTGAPVVPTAINGSSWFAFRWPVRIRYGAPLVIAEGEKFRALDDKGWKVTHQQDSYGSHTYGGVWMTHGGCLGAGRLLEPRRYRGHVGHGARESHRHRVSRGDQTGRRRGCPGDAHEDRPRQDRGTRDFQIGRAHV